MTKQVDVICGDCREIVPTVGRFDFVFADPPALDNGQGAVPTAEYDSFTREWMKLCWRACSGILAAHGDDNLAESCLVAARRLKMRRIGWINWAYKPKQGDGKAWPDARRHCLIFARGDSPTWNPAAVCRQTELGRIRLPGTIWGGECDGPHWGRIIANSYERWEKSRGQLPEVYLARLIGAYTAPGARVLDPFAGSGTTAVVAQELGRECVTIDQSNDACEKVRRRLLVGALRDIGNHEIARCRR
ncbi:site-specific DNA-methyltransferase [Roseiconus nitratireducens]|uniref:Methyltransferase n=1 Tax=Roseiconus nitratireducens TaxID=2605748 RepID=A0A5M6CTV8_9BACT|nr:site-specific DNA-methyltransferase [Roseiconus nitratireducens]KAA5538718.1 site-specific DNA-methyltransferase [Roseiconus nitratireducens]